MNEFVGYHFGCGGHRIPGWQNFDIEMDISKPLPLPDDSADMCMASHVMEHVSGPDALRFLIECHRVLKVGGKLRLITPVIGPWLAIDHARDLCLGHGHMCTYNEESLRTMLWMAGFNQQAIRRTDREVLDHHHHTIGLELDAIESCRLEATK